jgi:hypothetical protein
LARTERVCGHARQGYRAHKRHDDSAHFSRHAIDLMAIFSQIASGDPTTSIDSPSTGGAALPMIQERLEAFLVGAPDCIRYSDYQMP